MGLEKNVVQFSSSVRGWESGRAELGSPISGQSTVRLLLGYSFWTRSPCAR